VAGGIERRKKSSSAGHAAVLSLAISLACAPAWAQQPPLVAAIEAAYLTKFPPFVDWPDGREERTSLTLCVLDDDQVSELAETAAKKILPPAHTEIVRRLESPTRIEGCDILFIGPATGTGIGPVLDAAASKPVLTITAGEPEGRKGIINFVVKDDRLRFEIDDAEAARHALRISSKLLSLAVSVKERMQRNPPP